MKNKFILSGCLVLNACAVLDSVPETQTVCIDSNITAFVYVNEKKVGQTPFCGGIERGLNTTAVLKANGYKTTEVPLKKGVHRQWMATSNAEGMLMQTGVNIVSLFVPTGMDMTYTSQGRWIEYLPDSYYVEMYSPYRRADLNDLKIKSFALKNYYPLKSGDAEYVKALSVLAQLPETAVFETAKANNTAAEFANSLSRQAKGEKQ